MIITDLDDIKNIWQKYKTIIIISILVIVGAAVFAYYKHLNQQIYQQRANKLGWEMIQTSASNPQQSQTTAGTLVNNYSESFYGQLASVALNKDSKNINNLKKVIDSIYPQNPAQELWYAMVMANYLQNMAENKADTKKALDILNKDTYIKQFPLLYYDLLGDLQDRNGNNSAAKQAYQQAIQNIPKNLAGMTSDKAANTYQEWIQLKLASVAR